MTAPALAISVSTAISSGRGELVNVRQRSLLMAKWRVLWVVAGFLLIALTAVLRLAFLGLFANAPTHQDMASALLPPRGDIVDRNGVPLARTFPAYSLWYNPAALGEGGPPLVRKPAEVAAALAAVFPDLDAQTVARRLAEGRPGYLRRRILPEDANRIHQLGEPALEFPRETERFYPQGSMAAHVLGFVGADGHGHIGMEQVYDQRLTDPAQRGAPAVLSIDARVQGALEDELMKGMLESNAIGAAGIILDVDTGEVLALASLPAFNPNLIDRAGEGHIFNRVTNQVYELGSTFKPISVAAAIDAGVVTDMSRRYQSNRPLEIGGFAIRDSHSFGASLNNPACGVAASPAVVAGYSSSATAASSNSPSMDRSASSASSLLIWACCISASRSPAPTPKPAPSSSGSSVSTWRCKPLTTALRKPSRSMVVSAISRRATTGFLSLSRSMVIGAP